MNKIYLLDTNIVSEFSKENPNPNVIEFYEYRKDQCAISSITWQELVFGVSRLPDGKRKNTIESFIQNLKQNIEIIPYDTFSAEICGNFTGTFEKKGHTLPYSDSQIAATAISNGMVLVTHNTSDFAPIAETNYLKMEDWFEA